MDDDEKKYISFKMKKFEEFLNSLPIREKPSEVDCRYCKQRFPIEEMNYGQFLEGEDYFCNECKSELIKDMPDHLKRCCLCGKEIHSKHFTIKSTRYQKALFCEECNHKRKNRRKEPYDKRKVPHFGLAIVNGRGRTKRDLGEEENRMSTKTEKEFEYIFSGLSNLEILITKYMNRIEPLLGNCVKDASAVGLLTIHGVLGNAKRVLNGEILRYQALKKDPPIPDNTA